MAGTCSGSNFPNCSAEYIIPDPDIAGIGVIISFVVVNALTIVVTTISLMFIELGDLQMGGFDLVIHKALNRLGLRPLSARMDPERVEFWLEILEKILLGLSDTQLLTGMAILIAGYVKCSISVYHSSIVSDLAWFASGTHLSSLQVLRRYMIKYPVTRIVRIVLLLAMGGLLLSLVIYQGNRYWFDSWATPAQCLFADTNTYGDAGGNPARWMAANIVLLVLGYSTSISFLFENAFSWRIVIIYKALMRRLSRLIRESIKSLVTVPSDIFNSSQIYIAIVILPFVIFAELVFVIVCLFPLAIIWFTMYFLYLMIDSYFIGALFDVFWWVFGLYYLIEDRTSSRDYMKDEDKGVENQWGFGQFVPCFLIFLPIMSAWEVWYEAHCDDKRDKEREARAAAFKDLSRPTTPLSRVHTPELCSPTVMRDERRRERAEDRAFDERLVNSLRPPPRAHQRSPSVDSDLDSDVGIALSPMNSRSQERLLPVTDESITGPTSHTNGDSTAVINTTGSGQLTMAGGESLSRRNTFKQ